MPILAAIAGLFVVVFIYQAAESAAHALWLVLALGLLAFVGLALWAWHRRQLEELRGLRIDHLTRYERVNKLKAWPKFCSDCGVEFSHWKMTTVHDDPGSSVCAKYRAELDEQEAAPEALPMDGFTAEVLGPTPGQQTRPGDRYAPGVDTELDELARPELP